MTQEQFEKSTSEATSLLHNNRELAVLYDIASYLNHIVDVHEALQEVLARVTELLGLRTGWVWLLNEWGHTYLAASQALPPYLADHTERMTGSCQCLDTFLGGELSGASNIDVLRCSRLKNAERNSDPSALGLRFHASVPIYAGDTRIGVLNVASEDWRGLQPEELQLLHIIGDQIGLAIQRARISAQHMHAAARLATIEERNRLAREIHDTIAQGLAAITLQLETADALTEARPERAQVALQRALRLARNNLEEARRSVMDLRAAPLQGRTLPEALQSLANDDKIMGERTGQTQVSFYYEPSPLFPPLPANVESGLYRIAQEALNNAYQHAQAKRVEITLEANEHQVRLAIKDNGRGFDLDTIAAQEGHFGLTGIGERVKLLNGTLCIESEPEQGTHIYIILPY
ncbi:GAF domain-containing sensor histidine kinase [Ktedonospora formicarum]|uniref:Sensor histidine kinase n=1 Tax=Ktedonospora formicarum TaxID=2778364 RepID=A0A8J3MRZ1_9CHLR|nr:GAF domain-containing sensor histidine kinase [Ktedonospora formicarum]GHO44306.1 sensor histidine kinase [Ktedonospora formicarum]